MNRQLRESLILGVKTLLAKYEKDEDWVNPFPYLFPDHSEIYRSIARTLETTEPTEEYIPGVMSQQMEEEVKLEDVVTPGNFAQLVDMFEAEANKIEAKLTANQEQPQQTDPQPIDDIDILQQQKVKYEAMANELRKLERPADGGMVGNIDPPEWVASRLSLIDNLLTTYDCIELDLSAGHMPGIVMAVRTSGPGRKEFTYENFTNMLEDIMNDIINAAVDWTDSMVDIFGSTVSQLDLFVQTQPVEESQEAPDDETQPVEESNADDIPAPIYESQTGLRRYGAEISRIMSLCINRPGATPMEDMDSNEFAPIMPSLYNYVLDLSGLNNRNIPIQEIPTLSNYKRLLGELQQRGTGTGTGTETDTAAAINCFERLDTTEGRIAFVFTLSDFITALNTSIDKPAGSELEQAFLQMNSPITNDIMELLRHIEDELAQILYDWCRSLLPDNAPEPIFITEQMEKDAKTAQIDPVQYYNYQMSNVKTSPINAPTDASKSILITEDIRRQAEESGLDPKDIINLMHESPPRRSSKRKATSPTRLDRSPSRGSSKRRATTPVYSGSTQSEDSSPKESKEERGARRAAKRGRKEKKRAKREKRKRKQESKKKRKSPSSEEGREGEEEEVDSAGFTEYNPRLYEDFPLAAPAYSNMSDEGMTEEQRRAAQIESQMQANLLREEMEREDEREVPDFNIEDYEHYEEE